jgi:formylglycine-generating enzyme required for sulfatase activity
MKFCRLWMLPVMLPVCGTIGCGEAPETVVEKPETAAREPKPSDSEREVADKPKAAMEKPEMAIAPFDADQAEQHQESWAAYLGVPVEITSSIGVKLKLIPAGEFMMGSPESHLDPFGGRKPPHDVRIAKPFYLGVYEVTQAEYENVMGKNPSIFKGASNPVEMVSWDDATEFCRRLSAKEGKSYRLPTEAEWEYACRAGTTTQYSFGDDPTNADEYAWHRGNSDGKTHPVGEKKPNAWGLHDVHGNVSEWCSDSTDAPMRPKTGGYRVTRGGCWGNSGKDCRAATRGMNEPQDRNYIVGFRVAAEPPSSSSQEQADK